MRPSDVRCVGPFNVKVSDLFDADASQRHAVAGLWSKTLPGPNTTGVPSASCESGAWHDAEVSRGVTAPATGAIVVVGGRVVAGGAGAAVVGDRKSTRRNSSHLGI